jgi:hypothetical protein
MVRTRRIPAMTGRFLVYGKSGDPVGWLNVTEPQGLRNFLKELEKTTPIAFLIRIGDVEEEPLQ